MEHSALADLVAATHVHLRGYLMGLGVGAGAVDDLVQEVYLHHLRQDERIPEGLPPIAWLKGIARHKAFDLLRRRTAAPTRLAIAEHLLRQAEAVEDVRLDHLRACVESLDGSAKALIAAHYRDGLRSDDIAARIGRSAVGVRKSLMHLRDALADCVRRRQALEVG